MRDVSSSTSHAATNSPAALEAPERIGALYKIEAEIRIKSPDQLKAHRQAHALPRLTQLHAWLQATVRPLSRKSPLGGAIGHALSRWKAITRYCGDGRIEIDNNAAEHALRTVALGRKNYLFAGSDAGASVRPPSIV
jgi:hypothetical protein